jgi:platelet-activating factor acetylhydrolase
MGLVRAILKPEFWKANFCAGAPVSIPDKTRTEINSPLLAINSEAFMYWQSNFDTLEELANEAKSSGQPAWVLTIRGTVHLSQSDFPILYSGLCALFFRMTADPKRALDINLGATLEFLHLVAPERSEIISRTMKAEDLLKVEMLEDMPTDHRPDDKYLAMKLKVPMHLTARLMPGAIRKLKRMGDPVVGPGEEIWMHLSTTKDELEKWRDSERSSRDVTSESE